MTFLAVRRADGKALRIDQRVKRQEAALADVREQLSALAAQVGSVAERVRDESRSVRAALGEDRAELAAHTATLSAHDDRLAEISAAVARIEALLGDKLLPEVRSRGDFGQVEAMIDLRAPLRPRAPLP